MRPLINKRLRRAAAISCSIALTVAGLNAYDAPAHAADTHSRSAASSSGQGATGSRLTGAQASAQAKASGKPVIASALTTPFDQTTANPNGSYTLTETAAPSRAWRGGAWAALDPTLRANPDGTISPAVTSSALTLSGGGNKPLATLDSGGQTVSLTLPRSLPKPTLSGNTATYAKVIPGVDLIVTVAPTGAFSDVFEVHGAAAATDPRLASLLSADIGLSSGLSQSVDAASNLTIADHGRPVFTAATPFAWDSATATTPAHKGTDLAGPAASGVAGPGRGAHLARLSVTATRGHLTLTAPSAITSRTSSYPVFLDPTYSPTYGANAWSSFGANSASGTQYYNKSTDPTGDAFIGLASDVGDVWSAFNFQLPDTATSSANNLTGAHIYSATFGITAITSGGYCNSDATNNVDLRTPDPANNNRTNYLTSNNADYAYWSANAGGIVGSPANFDGAQTCGNSGTGSFNVQSAVAAEVGTYKTGNQTFVLSAADTSDYLGTKQFIYSAGTAGNPRLTVTYDKAPGAPTGLTISAGNGCGSTVGDGSLSLLAHTNDVMPFQLTTTFDLYEKSDGTKTNQLTTTTATNNGVNSDTFISSPGQPAVLALPEAFLKALSPTTATPFEFYATSTDGQLPSAASSTCDFTFDPTRPGPPTVAPTANSQGVTCATVGSSTGTAQQVGATCAFSLAPPNNTTISGYTYQLDEQPSVTVSTTASSYPVTITVPQIINSFTVNALSAGGNIGQSQTVDFNATTLNPPAVDGSVTNDGEPDMIAAGGTGALPAGLWLAQGRDDGSLSSAVNIGLKGLGYSDQAGTDLATDWTGASVITGDFCGLGAQDVMAYYPSTGGAAVDCSTGSADQLTVGPPIGASAAQINNGGTFGDGANDNATQLANAYNTSGKNTGVPDLFATVNNKLYLFESTSANSYGNDAAAFGLCSQDCDILTGLSSPDGNADWNSWTITSAQVGTATDMYLWNKTTGALYLWTNITANTSNNTISWPNYTTLTYNSYTLASSGWHTGATTLQLRAATLKPTSAAPALWTLDVTTGATTAYTPDLTVPTINTGAPSQINTSNHSWQFVDMPSGASGAALASSADSIPGGPALTGNTTNGGVVWHTGDIHSPDAMLNTKSDEQSPDTTLAGDLYTTGPAVTFGSSFTVSAAVRPNAAGGAVLSQNGTNTAGFTLGSTSAGQWQFCMAHSDAAAPTLDCATGGAVNVGLWSTLTATFDTTTGMMRLYVNGAETSVTGHAKTTGLFTADFQVGDSMASGKPANYYSGQVAAISTWNADVPPAQPATAGSDYVPVTPTRILDTRSTSKIGTVPGPVAAGSTTTLAIAGNTTGGLAIPASGITAAAISITEVNATTNGFLTVFPDSTPQPITSTLNYAASAPSTNNAIIPVGTDGKIAIYNNSTGTAQIIIDISGYYTTATSSNASTYVPLTTPTRVLDTRNGTGATQAKLAANAALALQIAGNTTNGADIPADVPYGTQITGVAINLTTANSSGNGQLIAYPDDGTTPTVSNVTYSSVGNATSTVIVPVETNLIASLNGKIVIYNQGTAPVDVIGDVSGYYTTSTTGQHYYAASADRILDTRLYNPNTQSASALLPDNGINLPVPANIAAYNPSMVLNLTVTQPTSNGVLNVYPGNQTTIPLATALNWASGQTVANLSLAASATSNSINLYNNSSGTIELIIDTNGYFE